MQASTLNPRVAVVGLFAVVMVGLALSTGASADDPSEHASSSNPVNSADASGPRADDGGAILVGNPPLNQPYARVPTWLHAAPDLGPLLKPPTPSLDEVRDHLRAADVPRAIAAAERYVAEHRWGRDAAAAWMALGLLYREQERHNLASESFTKVRLSRGPLAEWGAWHEAEQDLERGRPWVAIKECDTYVKTYPEGQFVDACQRLQARANVETGNYARARALAKEYDERLPDGAIAEHIEVLIVRRLMTADPAAAVPLLQQLAVSHAAPLTGRFAEDALAALYEAGHEQAVIPSDSASLIRRALSLRDVKRKHEAWAIFEQLQRLADDDPTARAFVERDAETFGWRTHRWDFLARTYGELQVSTKGSKEAWDTYRALSRGGRFDEAATVAVDALVKHGQSRDWKWKEEEIGRTMMLAGRYAEAAVKFDDLASRRGWSGRRGAYYAAFSTYMSGEHDKAIARLTSIIDTDRNHEEPARYWRARALDALDRPDEAAADRAWLAANSPTTWYGTLAAQPSPDAAAGAQLSREGRWPGGETAARASLSGPLPQSSFAPTASSTPPAAGTAGNAAPAHIGSVHKLAIASGPAAPVPVQGRPPSSGFGALRWAGATDIAVPTFRDPAPDAPPSLVVVPSQTMPPRSYPSGNLYDERQAMDALRRFANTHEQGWPELQAVVDFTKVGLYDHSGPLISRVFEEWREAYRLRTHPKHQHARKIPNQNEQWRQLFLVTRDHHHTARFVHGLWDQVETPELRREAMTLGYPLAHDRTLWAEARTHSVDPFLVLGLMRQESTYNANAVSRVGARGAMQIMPRTGHLLADIKGMHDYTTGDLEDPILSIRLGVSYLGLLLDRFDGAWPLAVASYNGGPFNVSSWLKGTGSDMPMDQWVEHIPFRETRDYVKKVTAGYADYTALYAPVGSRVIVPRTPRGDDPDIVDF